MLTIELRRMKYSKGRRTPTTFEPKLKKNNVNVFELDNRTPTTVELQLHKNSNNKYD
jgi:hypothetical protein